LHNKEFFEYLFDCQFSYNVIADNQSYQEQKYSYLDAKIGKPIHKFRNSSNGLPEGYNFSLNAKQLACVIKDQAVLIWDILRTRLIKPNEFCLDDNDIRDLRAIAIGSNNMWKTFKLFL